MAPQTFLYGCELESGKDVVFNPDDDDFEHQLDLRMACVDARTKDELHVVEVEGQDIEGQNVKAILVSIKPSVLPSVCLSGFTITPPVTFRLKAGSGPIHLSGQHLVMAVDQSFEDEDDEDEEEEEEEDVKMSKKRPAPSPADKSKKKMKLEVDDDDDEDDEEDEDDDDEDDEDDDDDEEDEEEESPVKVAPPSAKPKAAAQNGKSPKPPTPGKNQVKTPKAKGEKSPKVPVTPREPLTPQQVKEKLLEAITKGVALPKVQVKFENFVKNSYRVFDDKIITDLWKWSQTVKDTK